MKRHKSAKTAMKRGSSKSPQPSKVGRKRKVDESISVNEDGGDVSSGGGKRNRSNVMPLKKGKKIQKTNVVKRGRGRPPKVKRVGNKNIFKGKRKSRENI